MKKALLFIISFTFSYMSFSQTRYIDEIFSDVTVHSDVNYGTNVSVLPLLLGALDANENFINKNDKIPKDNMFEFRNLRNNI